MIKEQKPETRQTKTSSKRRRSVAVYLTILFAVAFLLLLLAYFMQQRNSQTIIGTLQNSANSIELLNEMIDENRALNTEISELEDALDQAEILLEQTKDQLAQAQLMATEAEQAALQEQMLLVSQLEAVLILERLEYLVATEQDEPARQQLDPSLKDTISVISDQYDYVYGQPTLMDRYAAVEAALFPAEETPVEE